MNNIIEKNIEKLRIEFPDHEIYQYRHIHLSLVNLFALIASPHLSGGMMDDMTVDNWCNKLIELNSGQSFEISVGDKSSLSYIAMNSLYGMRLLINKKATNAKEIKKCFDDAIIQSNFVWNSIKKNSTVLYIITLIFGGIGSAGFTGGHFWMGVLLILAAVFLWCLTIFKDDIIFDGIETVRQGKAALEQREYKRVFSPEFYYLSEGKLSDRLIDAFFKQFGRRLVGSPLVTSITPVRNNPRIKLSNIYKEYVDRESTLGKLLDRHEYAIMIRSGIGVLIGSAVLGLVIFFLYKLGYGPEFDLQKNPSGYLIGFYSVAMILWMVLVQICSRYFYKGIAMSCFVGTLISLYVELNRKSVCEFSSERAWISSLFDECIYYLKIIKKQAVIANPYVDIGNQFEKIESDLMRYKSYTSFPLKDTNSFIKTKLKDLIPICIHGRYGEYVQFDKEILVRNRGSLLAEFKENIYFAIALSLPLVLFALQNYKVIDLGFIGLDGKTINTLLISSAIIVISTKLKTNVLGSLIDILRGK